MGPDGFGKNVERLKDKNYIERLRRLNFFRMVHGFGPLYLVNNLLGRRTLVGTDNPERMRQISNEGHEIGIHGWDHFWWAENVWTANTETLLDDTLYAFEAFMHSIEIPPIATAAPNWRTSIDYLKQIDLIGFNYIADVRGSFPFLPAHGDWEGKTIHIPFNLPCLHEIANSLSTNSEEEIAKEWFSNLHPDYNVWCIHDYYEGILRKSLFKRIVNQLLREGFKIVPLGSLIREVNHSKLPRCGVEKGSVAGGRGFISKTGPRN